MALLDADRTLANARSDTDARWQKFSDATLEDLRETAQIIRSHGGVE